ncbi:MAG TPA: endonuclease [Synergistales bacterium]|nr:endonuclease [Synergistales bacterium]
MLIAVDPGTDKFGWAVTTDSGDLLLSGVSVLGDLEAWAAAVLEGDFPFLVERAIERFDAEDSNVFPGFVIVGSGTGSAPCIKRLASAGLRVEQVPEEYSSERGRALYWQIHPPRGLRRLIPRGLLVPPRSVDDLAAWSLVLRRLGRDGPARGREKS